jgi:hypothetical protein
VKLEINGRYQFMHEKMDGSLVDGNDITIS